MLSIDWHVSGDIIVTGGIDNIRLWSVESGNALQRITIARQSAQKETIVWAVAILKVTVPQGFVSSRLVIRVVVSTLCSIFKSRNVLRQSVR